MLFDPFSGFFHVWDLIFVSLRPASMIFTVCPLLKTLPAMPCPGLTRMGCSRFEAFSTSISMRLSYLEHDLIYPYIH